jgi:hypothetical protein
MTEPNELNEQTKKSKQGRRDCKTLIAGFTEVFVKKAVESGGPFKEGDTHAFFSFGSVVRFNINTVEDTKEWDYKPEDDDYPKHRVTGEKIKDIFKENIDVYKQTLKDNEPYANTIKSAYRKLMKDGYPFPGGSGGDSIPVPMCEYTNKELIGVIFPELGDILTLGLTNDDVNKEHISCRECRRYDYMFPRIIAIMDHTLKLTYLQ